MILIYGISMHNVIQQWIKDLYSKGATFCKNIDYKILLKQNLKDEYKNEYTKHGKHFSTPEDIMEYYYDGCEILEYLIKNRARYFSLKDMKLIGIELPIYYSIDPIQPNIKLMAYIDLVMYEPSTKKYIIYDIKTSRKGWQKWDKENKNKTNQLILYKKYFSEQYGIPIQSINVHFFIVRQKVNPDSMWPQKRVQTFSPTSGSRTIKLMQDDVNLFIQNSFKNGMYIDNQDTYSPNSGKNGWNCTFCPYNERHDLCNPAERK